MADRCYALRSRAVISDASGRVSPIPTDILNGATVAMMTAPSATNSTYACGRESTVAARASAPAFFQELSRSWFALQASTSGRGFADTGSPGNPKRLSDFETMLWQVDAAICDRLDKICANGLRGTLPTHCAIAPAFVVSEKNKRIERPHWRRHDFVDARTWPAIQLGRGQTSPCGISVTCVVTLASLPASGAVERCRSVRLGLRRCGGARMNTLSPWSVLLLTRCRSTFLHRRMSRQRPRVRVPVVPTVLDFPCKKITCGLHLWCPPFSTYLEVLRQSSAARKAL